MAKPGKGKKGGRTPSARKGDQESVSKIRPTQLRGEDRPPVTTEMVGEDRPRPTTLRVGEEDGPTTKRVGEEDPKTMAIMPGEHGPTRARGEDAQTEMVGEDRPKRPGPPLRGHPNDLEGQPNITTRRDGEENKPTKKTGEEPPEPTMKKPGAETGPRRPDASKQKMGGNEGPDEITTLAVGEEAPAPGGPIITTMAKGEEQKTTEMFGEEHATTKRFGEEHITTTAEGEEHHGGGGGGGGGPFGDF